MNEYAQVFNQCRDVVDQAFGSWTNGLAFVGLFALLILGIFLVVTIFKVWDDSHLASKFDVATAVASVQCHCNDSEEGAS